MIGQQVVVRQADFGQTRGQLRKILPGTSMNDLLQWRSEFPTLENSTYMISNSLGAMPRAVYDSMRGYADAWGQRGIRAWEEIWMEMAMGAGDKIAPLIGAAAGEISLHQNVTITQAIISSCFDYRGPRNKVVMVDLEFPSVQYFYNEQRRLGALVETVASENSVRFDLQKFLAAIDETTLLVPISQVSFRNARIALAHTWCWMFSRRLVRYRSMCALWEWILPSAAY